MVSSSDGDGCTSIAQQRKKKKRLSQRKRKKMQANREQETGSTQTVASKFPKLTKLPFSPKRPEKKNCPKEKKKERFSFPTLKSRSKSKNPSENDGTPKKGSNKVKTSENGSTPKKGFERVKSILKKKPDTMDQQTTQIEKLQKKLNAAKFRYLNEKLYTESGNKSFDYFQSDRESFKVYHEGFQDQVERWPLNPLDKIIAYVRTCARTSKIADFGCGEALLAQSVPHEVASFDLVAINKHVTACDMSSVPLKIACMDVAVFCLSLMGTNMSDYIIEAGRVLKNKGIMLIAEVVSRFEDPMFFVREVEKLGFCHLSTTNYKMFVIMKFIRDSSKTKVKKSSVSLSLKACVYKKR